MDNSSGLQLFLSESGLSADITTAKSTGINVLIPGKTEEDDPVSFASEICIFLQVFKLVPFFFQVEIPLPEQFVHTFKDGKFVTSPVSHSAG